MRRQSIPALVFVILSALSVLAREASSVVPYGARLSQMHPFHVALKWVGTVPPSEADSKELYEACVGVAGTNCESNVAGFERFVAERPDSPWTPATLEGLANYYRFMGRYTLALERWQRAWDLTRQDTEGAGRSVADLTLVNWTSLLAKLGRTEDLAEILKQAGHRSFETVTLQKRFNTTVQALAVMRRKPEVSYRCGTYALAQVGEATHQLDDAGFMDLVDAPSPATGFSMLDLMGFIDKFKMDLIPVSRPAGDDQIVVPSVIHWRQNHYAAIVALKEGLYHVVDPTFGTDKWLRGDVMNAEASGHFFVPVTKKPTSWPRLSSAEAGAIFGKGNDNSKIPPPPPCPGCPCPPGSGGGGGGGGGGGSSDGKPKTEWTGSDPGGCSTCAVMGMASWRVAEPYIELWVTDNPLSYAPSRGQDIGVWVDFHQNETRPENASIYSFGPCWNCNWLTYMDVTDANNSSSFSNYTAELYAPMGGEIFYAWDDIGPDPRTHSAFSRLMSGGSAVGFAITYPNGSQAIYGLLTNVTTAPLETRAFLTQWISPQGYTNLFQYQTGSRILLTNVVDVDGRNTSLSYNTSFPGQVAQITSPYASVNFYYASSGILTNIVDAVGISSQFQYVWSNGIPLMTNMSTPYGATAFKYFGPDVTTPDVENSTNIFNENESNSPAIAAAIQVTEPTGGVSLFMYQDITYQYDAFLGPYYSASGLDGSYGDGPDSPYAYFPSALQTDLTTGVSLCCNDYMESRNSFYWGPLQCQRISSTIPQNLLASDYLLARTRNGLHGSRNGTMLASPSVVSHTLNMERAPSQNGVTPGQSTWYGYLGKNSGDFAEGTNVFPSLVVQPEPDYFESYNLHYDYWTYNQFGEPTTNISSYGPEVPNPYNSYHPATFINMRTNLYTYAPNALDLTSQILLDGANVVVTQSNLYNVFHEVATNYDALHQQTTYVYNTNRQLSSSTTPAGLTTVYTYSTNNYLQRVVDTQISRTNSYSWAGGQIYQRTNELGLVETDSWDALRRLTGKTFSDGTSLSNVYTVGLALAGGTGTTLMDVTARKDRGNCWTHYGYNGIRQKIAETNALGKATLYEYCACGALEAIVDAAGETSQFLYDDAGEITNHIYPDGSFLVTAYNSLGEATNLLDGAGNSVTNYYNNQGLVDASTNAAGRVFAVVYDIRSRVTRSSDETGVAIVNTYDNLDRLLTRSYPDGGVERFGYAAAGLTAYTNQVTNVTYYSYDAATRKIGETNAIQAVIQYAYDAAGNLSGLTDGNNHTTKWSYDLFGRLINKVDAVGVTNFIYQYDGDNRLTNRWTPQKGSAGYKYDAVGNLTNVIYQASPNLVFGYDAVNRLISMSDGMGNTTFSYTSNGYPQTETGPWAEDTMTYRYANRLRSSISLQEPGGGAWSQSYVYDGNNRLKTVTSQAGTFTYIYDRGLNGNATSSPLIDEINVPTGAAVTNTFDQNGRWASSVLRTGSSTLNSFASYYNVAGRDAYDTRQSTTHVAYGYDGIGELRSDWASDGGVARWNEQLSYVYDNAGNLVYRTNNTLVENFLTSPDNELAMETNWGRLTVAGTTTVSATNVAVNGTNASVYSDATFAATNMPLTTNYTAIAQDIYNRRGTNAITVTLSTSSTFKYDLNGNLTNDGLRNFAYDDENELIQVSVSNQWMAQFQYDGRQRRRARGEFAWTNGAWARTAQVYYVYDGNLVIQERDQDNLPNVTYTRGNDLGGSLREAGGIGGLLARTDATLGQTAYYHSDNHGNITMLINSSNAVAAKYLYDAFGNVLSAAGSLANSNLQRFSSKEAQANSGLVYFLFRFYDPNLQRWLTRDPIENLGFATVQSLKEARFATPPQVNSWMMTQNDTLDWIDPFGLRISGKPPTELKWDNNTEVSSDGGVYFCITIASVPKGKYFGPRFCQCKQKALNDMGLAAGYNNYSAFKSACDNLARCYTK